MSAPSPPLRRTRASASELVAIGVLAAGVVLERYRLPTRVTVGDAVITGAVLLLVQGLVRDLFQLAAARRRRAEATRSVRCMCAESTIGISGIVAGAVLVFGSRPAVVTVAPMAWPAGVLAVGLFGFATRNLVLDWDQKKLRWERDHGGVVVGRR